MKEKRLCKEKGEVRPTEKAWEVSGKFLEPRCIVGEQTVCLGVWGVDYCQRLEEGCRSCVWAEYEMQESRGERETWKTWSLHVLTPNFGKSVKNHIWGLIIQAVGFHSNEAGNSKYHWTYLKQLRPALRKPPRRNKVPRQQKWGFIRAIWAQLITPKLFCSTFIPPWKAIWRDYKDCCERMSSSWLRLHSRISLQEDYSGSVWSSFSHWETFWVISVC